MWPIFFEVEGSKLQYEAGDVLVISPVIRSQSEKSSAPYSTWHLVYMPERRNAYRRNAEEDKLDDMVPLGIIGAVPAKYAWKGWCY